MRWCCMRSARWSWSHPSGTSVGPDSRASSSWDKALRMGRWFGARSSVEDRRCSITCGSNSASASAEAPGPSGRGRFRRSIFRDHIPDRSVGPDSRRP
jgi:hypothetical protein